MFTSSMSTSQIPGARRLWCAQTNPYATRKLVRASVAASAKPWVAVRVTAVDETEREDVGDLRESGHGGNPHVAAVG